MAPVEIMRLPSAEHPASGQRFDYRGMHRYIITLPTYHEKPLFNTQDRVFSVLGRLREDAVAHKFDVYAYCLLPAKLLLIIRGRDETSDMKGFLAAFRGATNAIVMQEAQHPAWSKKYIERVLRKGEESKELAKQIFGTPVKEGLVKVAAEYPYLGSFVIPLEKILFPPRPASRPPFRERRKVGPPARKPWKQGVHRGRPGRFHKGR